MQTEGTSIWLDRAKELLTEALDHYDERDVIADVEMAVAAMRIAVGERPESDLADYYRDLDEDCTCTPKQRAGGGFKGSCPVHGSRRLVGEAER